MKKSAASVLWGAVMCLTASGAAVAANREAQQVVASAVKEQTTLLGKFPALVQIDSVIRSDCAAKNQGKLATDEFCGCASAMTMSLWRSGADPKMIPRLTDYLRNPTEAGAAAFLQYEGPELYRPICTAASKR